MIRTPRAALDDHLADSLVALDSEVVRNAEAVLDLGTGAGLPGLPLANNNGTVNTTADFRTPWQVDVGIRFKATDKLTLNAQVNRFGWNKFDAIRLGAHEVVNSKNDAEMQKHAGTFEFILDTVPAAHNINAYINLLKRDGTLGLVGAPAEPLPLDVFGLLFARRNISGSIIGGIRETQEMLDYCAEKNITSDVEVIPIQQVEAAWERTVKGDVRYRFVIDMQTL